MNRKEKVYTLVLKRFTERYIIDYFLKYTKACFIMVTRILKKYSTWFKKGNLNTKKDNKRYKLDQFYFFHHKLA